MSLAIFFSFYGKVSGADLTYTSQICPCLELSISRQPPMHLDNSHTIEIEADGLLIRMSNEIKPLLLKMLMDTLKESLC